MKQSLLPISLCHANCSNCCLPTEFQMFESGGGGDFSTYVGKKTKNIYRVDLGKIHYLGISLNDLLLPAIELEGGIENLAAIPKQIQCKVCKTTFSAEHCMIDSEERVYAYQL